MVTVNVHSLYKNIFKVFLNYYDNNIDNITGVMFNNL